MKIKNFRIIANGQMPKQMRHFKSESNLKAKNDLLSDRDIIHKMNYNLYKYNEEHRKKSIRNYSFSNLLSNLKTKNFNTNKLKGFYNKIELNNLDENNADNYININRKNFFKINPKFIRKNKTRNKYISHNNSKNFLPLTTYNNFIKKENSNNNKILSKKSIYNNINNKSNKNNEYKLCLVPLFYALKNKNKNKKFNSKRNLFKRGIFNDKGEFEFYKSKINNSSSKANTSSYLNINKDLSKNSKNNYKSSMSRLYSESKDEEDDMKPKTRFMKLKKELYKENLNIYKMFSDFSKQISERAKYIKFIGNHKDKENNKFIEDNLIKNKF